MSKPLQVVEQITGEDICTGDVIQSAAMREPQRVETAFPSSTGRTMECTFEKGPSYRIGMTSKVRRYVEPMAEEIGISVGDRTDIGLLIALAPAKVAGEYIAIHLRSNPHGSDYCAHRFTVASQSFYSGTYTETLTEALADARSRAHAQATF